MTPSAITLIVTPTAQPATTTEVTTRTAHARSGDHLRGQSYPGSSALTRPHPTAIGSTSSGEWPLSHLRDCRQTSVVTGCHQGEINIRTRAVPQAVLRPIPQRTAWRPAPAEACRGRTRTPSAPASWGQLARRRHHRDVPRPRDGQPLMSGLADVRLLVEPAAPSNGQLSTAPTTTCRPSRQRWRQWPTTPAPPQPPPEADAAFHRALLNATRNETLARMDMLLEPGLCTCDPRARPRSRHRSRTQPPGRTRRRPRP